MFVPYFDCSYSGQGNGSVVVAGWLSTGEAWVEFEKEWKQVLVNFDVPHFHMKEFAHSRGAFENGWKGNEERRRAFLSALVAAIDRRIVAGFGVLMNCATFAEVDREFQATEFFGNEYALLGRMCAAHVKRWLYERGRELPSEYVFEDGDKRGRLISMMENDGFPSPSFKPSRDKYGADGKLIAGGLVPLQAADFAAYELRKAWDDFGDAETWEEMDRYRLSFRALGKAMSGSGYWGKCTAKDLREICEAKNVPKRV